MEADKIALQQAADDLFSPWHHIEHVGGWEIGVVEESNGQVRTHFAQVGGHHPEVVIVNPHGGVFCRFQCGLFGEFLVHLQEHLPVFLKESRALPKGMQGWPESLLGEFLVEDIHFLLGQVDPGNRQIRVFDLVDRRAGLVARC